MKRKSVVLAEREESSIVSTWMKYLCFCTGDEKKYRLFNGRYEALAEREQYYNEETEDYDLPQEIDGVAVAGLEDDHVVGGDLMWYDQDDTVEFDLANDKPLGDWLASHSWDTPTVRQAIEKAILADAAPDKLQRR